MQFFKIEQQEIGVISAKEGVLWAAGVSTCLCILIKGTIDGKDYLAMFHWDGLPHGFDRHSPLLSARLEMIVCNIFKAMRLRIKTSMRSLKKPELSFCLCIGGQKATESLSGTEVEVGAIETYSQIACGKYFRVMSDAPFLRVNFLTTDNQSLRVVFSKEKIMWCDDREPFVDEVTKEPIDEDAPSDDRVSYYVRNL